MLRIAPLPRRASVVLIAAVLLALWVSPPTARASSCGPHEPAMGLVVPVADTAPHRAQTVEGLSIDRLEVTMREQVQALYQLKAGAGAPAKALLSVPIWLGEDENAQCGPRPFDVDTLTILWDGQALSPPRAITANDDEEGPSHPLRLLFEVPLRPESTHRLVIRLSVVAQQIDAPSAFGNESRQVRWRGDGLEHWSPPVIDTIHWTFTLPTRRLGNGEHGPNHCLATVLVGAGYHEERSELRWSARNQGPGSAFHRVGLWAVWEPRLAVDSVFAARGPHAALLGPLLDAIETGEDALRTQLANLSDADLQTLYQGFLDSHRERHAAPENPQDLLCQEVTVAEFLHGARSLLPRTPGDTPPIQWLGRRPPQELSVDHFGPGRKVIPLLRQELQKRHVELAPL